MRLYDWNEDLCREYAGGPRWMSSLDHGRWAEKTTKHLGGLPPGSTVLVLLYRLLHRGLRVYLVERIVIATSLTHFVWWRRYRAPRKAVAAPSTDDLASVQAVERPQ